MKTGMEFILILVGAYIRVGNKWFEPLYNNKHVELNLIIVSSCSVFYFQDRLTLPFIIEYLLCPWDGQVETRLVEREEVVDNTWNRVVVTSAGKLCVDSLPSSFNRD